MVRHRLTIWQKRFPGRVVHIPLHLILGTGVPAPTASEAVMGPWSQGCGLHVTWPTRRPPTGQSTH